MLYKVQISYQLFLSLTLILLSSVGSYSRTIFHFFPIVFLFTNLLLLQSLSFSRVLPCFSSLPSAWNGFRIKLRLSFLALTAPPFMLMCFFFYHAFGRQDNKESNSLLLFMPLFIVCFCYMLILLVSFGCRMQKAIRS